MYSQHKYSIVDVTDCVSKFKLRGEMTARSCCCSCSACSSKVNAEKINCWTSRGEGGHVPHIAGDAIG